ncbi:Nif3-like dinuclear metal center hexameric protein [Sanguibacter antarcticus]|uniref:Nif3-like dinuclear metal center hexameric protein n=1 Tax=Sanguibacter antarcticus TaxID=372484 RepID=UPI001FE79F90|nr:Nif3-like dinuclear metal center hexameric protein [Sanguibacter antarcticus]
MTPNPLLSDVLSTLDARFPPSTAESWDRVGLVVGDPRQSVRKVLFAVDPVSVVIEEALEWGADLLVTHHPLLLDPVSSVAVTTAKGAAITALVRGGCALYVAHTNADAADGGVADALADVVGLVDRRPLVAAQAHALDKHVVYVPTPSAAALVDAMSAAGAGAIGEYSRVAWTTTGTGTFVPSDDAHPAIGSAGVVEEVDETRVEMVAPRALRDAVLAAVRAAHPYEEVAFDVLELAPRDSTTGLGRVGTLERRSTLRELAEHVAAGLPPTAQGVRVAGDLDAKVVSVAVLGGSGGSLFDAVRAAGVDVYVTSDLKHHQVSELREEVEFQAVADGRAPQSATPFIIDTAHFASEWPWLQLAARDLVHDVGAIGTTVETRVSTRRTDPWVARFGPSDPVEN